MTTQIISAAEAQRQCENNLKVKKAFTVDCGLNTEEVKAVLEVVEIEMLHKWWASFGTSYANRDSCATFSVSIDGSKAAE